MNIKRKDNYDKYLIKKSKIFKFGLSIYFRFIKLKIGG